MAIGYDTRIDRDVTVARSNYRSITAKQTAIRAALKGLAELRYEIVDDIDMAIAAIRSEIPERISEEEVRAVIRAPREPERSRYTPGVERKPNTDNSGLTNLRD
jgi:ribosomal 50S subunit-associated protein YjgA (DUF615 family)